MKKTTNTLLTIFTEYKSYIHIAIALLFSVNIYHELFPISLPLTTLFLLLMTTHRIQSYESTRIYFRILDD